MWLRHLETMDETNFVKRVREERVPGQMKRGRLQKSWDEVVIRLIFAIYILFAW